MKMRNREWKEFKVSDIFTVSTGSLVPKEILKKGKVARLTATDNNNGIFDFYETVTHKNYREFSNFISISFLGSVFYHPYLASLDMKIHAVQIPHIKLNRHVAEFLVLCFRRMTSNISYGNQLSSTDLPQKKILLPINSVGKPDYAFMESYMRQMESGLLKQYKKQASELKGVIPLSKKEWNGFEIGELFEISAGKSKGLNHLQSVANGGVNYLGATNQNNGVLAYVKTAKQMMHKGNSICFIRNGEGSMGFSVYKAEDFIATSDISVGYADFLNKYIGLFITTVADKVRGKYNFGYKRNETRLKKEKILLPVDSKNEPDYAYMENFMKSLEDKKIRQYLEYISNRP